MEDELRCPSCKQFFNNPVLLPCYHSLCLNCAINLQQPAHPNDSVENSGGSTGSTSSTASDHQDVDKLSILSETDSGVVCSSSSRPNSYVGTPNFHSSPLANTMFSLSCIACRKTFYFDEHGANNLIKYRIMQNIVDKYGETKNIVLKCQLCELVPASDATVICEQCEILYCEKCRENCHPARGPLAKHSLLSAAVGKTALRNKHRNGEMCCDEHPSETLTFFCQICRLPVCNRCMLENRHAQHDVQPISAICKAQKTELSQNLQLLSEKARSTTEFIQRLKSITELLNDNSIEFESQVVAQCDALIKAIEDRKRQLVDAIRLEKESKQRVLKEQVTGCACKLQRTTALLQFCIEALKETDAAAFLQVGSMLIHRVASDDMTWHKDVVTSAPRVSSQVDLTLDDKQVLRSIQQLNFIQMKPPKAPGIIPEECSAENNSVTLAWQPPPTSYVEGYVLELDDGNGGDFREVYCGKETICTVDGLHFNSLYNARVKAFNATGEGEYSELIGLQTSEVAWFTLDPVRSASDLFFSPEHTTVTCDGYEHRVALSVVGFSKGTHYWEFVIDRYDSDTDPSFGIARLDVARDEMLGKDDKGWSMYIDKQRSWFMHASIHDQRTEGGIAQGSTVGVLLDLDRHLLRFFVNEEPQGPIAFHNLYGVFYPAVSLNRGVTVTLHTGLEVPPDYVHKHIT